MLMYHPPTSVAWFATLMIFFKMESEYVSSDQSIVTEGRRRGQQRKIQTRSFGAVTLTSYRYK